MNFLSTSLPSPSNGVWYLGPFPIRAYAFSILFGIGVAIYVGNKRWVARGGLPDQVTDIAMWAVPFGIIGGRLYHVLTDWSAYFSGNGKGFLASLKIWEGGLGIWGAIALGGVGAYIGAKRLQISFLPFADAIAPGIVLAQAIGRWGNWFNQELFGKPTTLPWGLRIDAVHRPVGFEEFETFHPTFLYESLACVAIAAILVWADKKFTMGYGRVFALYVALYCSARGAIETIRIDEAHHILGIRLNVFTALIVGALALVYLVLSAERYHGREEVEDGMVPSARARRERQQRKLEMTGMIPVIREDTPEPVGVASAAKPGSRAARRAAVEHAAPEQAAPEPVETPVVAEAPEPVQAPVTPQVPQPEIGLTQAIDLAIMQTSEYSVQAINNQSVTDKNDDQTKERGRRRKR